MRYPLILFGLCLAIFGVLAATNNPVISKLSIADEIKAPEKISSSWGQTLNPEGIIPNEGFKAIYFSRSNPDSAIYSEDVESISIKYSWSDFHGIDSQSFAAYWVGQLNFEKPTTKQISISQSWAKSRILINGNVVFDGKNSSDTIVYEFEPGQHVVEVEYINNWHTVEYKVTIQDEILSVTGDQLASYFQDSRAGDANLYYVGLYESSAKDTTVDISLPSTGKSAIVWLSSYEAIDWKINSRDKISAVVVAAYSPGSRVSGIGAGRVMYLQDWRHGIYGETSQCSCAGGNFHCEQKSDLEDVAEQLSAVTGLNLSGYAVKYSAKSLTIQSYGDDTINWMRGKKADNADAQEQCEGEANPDFDTMIDDW